MGRLFKFCAMLMVISRPAAIYLRRAVTRGAVLVASTGALMAQLPVPDGPVNPGQLVSYDITVARGDSFYKNCTLNSMPFNTFISLPAVPRGQPLPKLTYACHNPADY